MAIRVELSNGMKYNELLINREENDSGVHRKK